MKNRKRVIFISVSFVLTTILFLAFSQLSKAFFSLNNKTLNTINKTHELEHKLDNEILKSSFFLYYDYNDITSTLDNIENEIKNIENIKYFKILFPHTYNAFLEYKKLYSIEKEKVLRYITINSIMKNSQIYIPSLALKYLKIAEGRVNYAYFNVLMKTVSTVFLLKNSLDRKYIKRLKRQKKVLKRYENILKTEKEKDFNRAFIAHINIIIKNFPIYKSLVDELIKRNETTKYLETLTKTFLQESENKSKIFSIFSMVVNALFLLFISFTSFLLIKIDKQNLKLKILTTNLEKALITDELTGLFNRFAFNRDVSKKYKNPSFILLNIDNFKSINDIYGNKIGDLVLIKLGHMLINYFKDKKDLNPTVYRLGADDFGILIENNKEKVYKLTEDLVYKIEGEKFIIDDLTLSITISAGISFTKPLFETADLALKKAKTSRERIVVYTENIETKEQLEKNLKILHLVKDALENDRIILYYQPVFDNKTGRVEEYEVLFRIKDKDGNIITPFEVLQVIKETKYYRYLTERVFKKALETLEKYPDITLSLNISYEDIADDYIKNNVILSSCSKDNLKGKIIFEILESESIKDFDSVREFVRNIRSCNMKFAIDDFGSGYSNFLYLAELKPDYLKIDGSLIREIHKKEELRKIVETINNFAHSLGIKTVAEFVHSEEVLKVVKEIGIDYSQGFYLGKPSPEIKS